jgi:hypothetical protein
MNDGEFVSVRCRMIFFVQESRRGNQIRQSFFQTVILVIWPVNASNKK